MNDKLFYTMFDVLLVAFEIFIINEYLKVFFTSCANTRNRMISYVLFFILLSGLSVLLPIPIVLLAITALCILLISVLFYNGSWVLKIFSAVSFIAMIVICEILVAYSASFLRDVPIPTLLNEKSYRIVLNITCNVLELLAVKILQITIGRTKGVITFKSYAPLLLCQIISIISIYTIFTYSYLEFYKNKILCIFSVGAFIYINIIILVYFDNLIVKLKIENEKLIAEKQFEQQISYYKNIIENQKEIHGLWHDLKKHLNILYRLLMMGDNPSALQYISDLNDTIKKIVPVVETGNSTINAVLNNAMIKAQELGIEMKLNINIPKELRISSIDLCVILGNTMENAIEACSKNKSRQIYISMRVKQGFFIYNIKNSTSSLTLTKSKDGLYRSSKDNHAYHGYGLQNVSRTVLKNSGRMSIEENNDIFDVLVILQC